MNAQSENTPGTRVNLSEMTVLDVVLIIFVLLLALGIILKTKFGFGPVHGESLGAAVYHDGELFRIFELDSPRTIDLLDGRMVVEIRDGQIRVQSSECPRQVCVNIGWIKQAGEAIVCVPFKTLMEIKSPEIPVVDAVVF